MINDNQPIENMFKMYDVVIAGTKVGTYEAENAFTAAMKGLKEEGYNGLKEWKEDFPNTSLEAKKVA